MMKIDLKATWTMMVMASCLWMAGCRKEQIKDYDVPATYDFDNVSYSGQTERLNMLSELSAYAKTAHTPGTVISEQTLRDMFENTNNPFTFTSTKQLKDKCFLADQSKFESYFYQIHLASQSTQPGSNGVAGVVFSQDSSKKYLFNETGWEYAQLIEKELMGAVFYYQATAVYLSDSKIGEDNVDNETITPGEGTEMEHHWDEAFGYLGVPKDFPANTTGLQFFGKYLWDREAVMGSSATLMNAFLKGRAAISHNDHQTKWEQVTTISETWEKVIAGTAIHYLNEAQAGISDDARRNHALSECVAFVESLKYNPSRKITDAQINAVTGAIGNNLYQVTLTGIDNARNTLSGIYGFEAIKLQL